MYIDLISVAESYLTDQKIREDYKLNKRLSTYIYLLNISLTVKPKLF